MRRWLTEKFHKGIYLKTTNRYSQTISRLRTSELTEFNDKPSCENGKMTSISELSKIICKQKISNDDTTIQISAKRLLSRSQNGKPTRVNDDHIFSKKLTMASFLF